MKKMEKILVLGACTILLCGCQEIPKLSDGSEAVVEFNDQIEGISANQLYEKMKESYALDSLITLMDTKILEKEYPNDLEQEKKSAKSTANSMVDTWGKDYVESYFGSVSNYENYIYLNNLQQKAILDYSKSLVTEKEIKDYYDKNIYGDVTVSHILIQTGVTDSTSSEEKTKLEEEAKNKINKIIEELNKAENKEQRFKELAKEYSDDASTKENGGSLGAINTGTLSSSYDEILKAARELKDKEYSKNMITTELGYHVIYKEKTDEKPSLEDKKEEIKESIANDKISNDATIRITAIDELRKKYGMNIKDSEIKEKYSNYIANQISNAQASNNQAN